MARGLFRHPLFPQQQRPTVQPLAPPAQSLALPALGGADYSATVIARAPIAYWRFGDSSSPAVDAIGAHNGTASGNVNFGQAGALAGDADTAVQFPATPGNITVAENAALHTGDVLSIAFLAKRTRSSVGDEYVAVKTGSGEWFVGFGAADYPTFGVNGQPNGFRSTSTVTDTNWHHIVFTKNGATVHVYLDGVEGTFDAGTVTVSHAAANDIWFGVNSLIGTLDEFALYDYALTQADVTALFTAVSGPGAAAVLYAPSLAVVGRITLGLLDAGAALYAPTLLPGPVAITPSLLDAGAAVYAPTLAQAGGVAQSLTIGFLDGSSATYAPALSIKVTVPFLDAGAALYAPSVSATISLGFLDAGATTFAPTLTPKTTLAIGFLDAGPSLSAPTLAPGPVAITIGFLDAGAAVYAPTLVATALTIATPLLDSGPALYVPAAISLQSLTVPLLDAGPALYAPTIVPTALTLAPALLDAGPALYAPIVQGATVGLTIPLLAGAPTVYAPTLANLAPYLVLPQLDAGAALYGPILGVGAVTITAGFLDGSPAIYPPVLGKLNTITLASIDGAAAVYAPAILGGIRDLGGFPPLASAYGPVPVGSSSSGSGNGQASTPVLVGTASHPKPGS